MDAAIAGGSLGSWLAPALASYRHGNGCRRYEPAPQARS